jgi:hypothetical protein
MFGLEGYLNAERISVRLPTQQQIVATTGQRAALSAVVMVMSVMVVPRWCRASDTCNRRNRD